MTLLKAMSDSPEELEVCVFRRFVAVLTSLQKQLDITYHDEKFLRDRLLTAVDIASIQTTLRDRMTMNSRDAVNRVANQLSDKPNYACSSITCTIDCEEQVANYSLGKSYGGEARRDVKCPWKRGRNFQSRRLNSGSMKRVKACFVCGEYHLGRTKHRKEDVKAAIENLKANHQQALLTIEDI